MKKIQYQEIPEVTEVEQILDSAELTEAASVKSTNIAPIKARKPLTDEQKKKRVENLAKARAAKKGAPEQVAIEVAKVEAPVVQRQQVRAPRNMQNMQGYDYVSRQQFDTLQNMNNELQRKVDKLYYEKKEKQRAKEQAKVEKNYNQQTELLAKLQEQAKTPVQEAPVKLSQQDVIKKQLQILSQLRSTRI